MIEFFNTMIIIPDAILPDRFCGGDRKERIFQFIKNAKRIDIKKGLFGLGKFLSFDECLKEEIIGVRDDIVSYVKRVTKARPFNIFIQAPPGSGKSFLVKSIRESVSQKTGLDVSMLPYFEINLSNINEYSELISFLKHIRGKCSDGKLPFIFLDEIDSEMPGFNIFQRMLMPMWDGAYQHDGLREVLPSSVLFFAGTPEGLERTAAAIKRSRSKLAEYVAILSNLIYLGPFDYIISLISKSMAALRRKEIVIEKSRVKWREARMKALESLFDEGALPKLPDFFNRIDQFIFLPSQNLYFKDCDDNSSPYFADLEMIYFFVIKITAAFPKVKYVTKRAMAVLCSKFYRSKRMMERLVFLSRCDERLTKFSIENLPRGLISNNDEIEYIRSEFDGNIQISQLCRKRK